MAETLPARANIEWLKKTAKQLLREWHSEGREAQLADAQLAVARQYGFSSWRALSAHVDKAGADLAADEPKVAAFLRAVGDGRIDDVRAQLMADPRLVDAVGPHPSLRADLFDHDAVAHICGRRYGRNNRLLPRRPYRN